MRKILFIIPFFLWTCRGVGGGSTPTEPIDAGTDAITPGGFDRLFWDGEFVHFQF